MANFIVDINVRPGSKPKYMIFAIDKISLEIVQGWQYTSEYHRDRVYDELDDLTTMSYEMVRGYMWDSVCYMAKPMESRN